MTQNESTFENMMTWASGFISTSPGTAHQKPIDTAAKRLCVSSVLQRQNTLYIPSQFEPPQDGAALYGMYARYSLRELHLRLLEQLSIHESLILQRSHLNSIFGQEQVCYYLPNNSYSAINPIMRAELPVNQTSHVGFIKQVIAKQQDLVQLIQQEISNRQSIINRIIYLKQMLGDQFKPSKILEIEESRKRRQKNLDGFALGQKLSNFSLEQVCDVLTKLFIQQFQTPQLSLPFTKVLTKMAQYYMLIFTKLNITEHDMQQSADFEKMFYDKVHQKFPNDIYKQPTGVKNISLKPYQLDGLRFLISMYLGNAQDQLPSIGKNVCGVCMADDMGLGKTLQTIAFMMYLHERKLQTGMHLIISPLPVSENWMIEFRKFAPSMNVILYKGEDREKARKEIMNKKGYYQAIITTYDYAMQDRSFFKKFKFDVVVVDEASRIKNCRSKLIGVLRNEIVCRFRLLLSGTPLQNNMRELFTLLQFIHGSVFQNFENFDSIFGQIITETIQKGGFEDEMGEDELESEDDTSIAELKECDLVSELGEVQQTPVEQELIEASSSTQVSQSVVQFDKLSNNEKIFIIYRLHNIIKPFMIRRIKLDVLDQLPPKDEVILRCPLSGLQQHLYQLAIQQAGRILDQSVNSQNIMEDFVVSTLPKYFIRNVDMYLRKICNHPYAGLELQQLQNLYYYYLDLSQQFLQMHEKQQSKLIQAQQVYEEKHPTTKPNATKYIQNIFLSNQMWRNSGKLELLHRMLVKFKQTNHRILIFSQFKSILNILEQFMIEREYKYLRFDGDVKDQDRNRMIVDFNKEDSPYFIFLLSTRAASHGLNLQTADTVISYDCDFNAFYDLQAQDRCYRIGQTKAVKVFKFYTNTMLEQKMLNVATGKLQMARTIIDAGGFTQSGQQSEKKTMRQIILDVFKSGQIIESNVEILNGSQLNKQLARNEQEFRIFENIDEQQEKEWLELNLGQKIEKVSKDVPEIFLSTSTTLLEQLREKYLHSDLALEEETKNVEKRGRKKQPPKEEQQQQNELQEEYVEPETLLANSIQGWINKDLYFTVFEEIQKAQESNMLINVYQFVNGIVEKQISASYSEIFKLVFQYMASDVIKLFLEENAQFTNVNYVVLFSGPQLQLSTYTSYLQYFNSSIKFENYQKKTIKASKFIIEINQNRIVFDELQQAAQTSNNEIIKCQIIFAIRILALLHIIFRIPVDGVDYTFDGKPSANKHITYYAAYQFWKLPTKEQYQQYYDVIKNPIPLMMIWFKAITLSYRSLHEFISDFRLLLQNCFAFNPKGQFLYDLGKKIEKSFNEMIDSVFTGEDLSKVNEDLKNNANISEKLGYGILDVLQISDDLTELNQYQEIESNSGQGTFGSGFYGGGFYDALAFDIVKYISKQKKCRQ